MADVVGNVLDVLAARVRDPQHTATSRSQMRLVLSWAQRIFNAKDESVKETVTVTTSPQRILYLVADKCPNAVRIVSIRQDGRDLTPVPYRSLRQTDLKWFRQRGVRFDSWAPVGRDAFLVVPVLDTETEIDVRYVKLLDPLVDDAQAFEVHEHDVPTVLAIAELLVNLRMHNIPLIQQAVEALK